MKRLFSCLVTIFALLQAGSAQQLEEVSKLYNAGQFEKAAEVGLAALQQTPENVELLIITGRALCNTGKFEESISPLQKALEIDRGKSWASGWAQGHLGVSYFALGKYSESQSALETAVKLNSTRNATAYAQRALLLQGFTDLYKGWPILETEHFRFHFKPSLEGINTNQFAASRESAFGLINRFFKAAMPKKIDFFVWRESEEAEKAGVGVLGFARPEVCIVHSRASQTIGHEMTHVISYQGLKPVSRSALINEGVAVYFDQTRRNRMATARQAVKSSKAEWVSIAKLWANLRSTSDGITYPVAGALIERLREKGGDDKLRALIRDQSLESTRKIYGPDLDDWIAAFEKELMQ